MKCSPAFAALLTAAQVPFAQAATQPVVEDFKTLPLDPGFHFYQLNIDGAAINSQPLRHGCARSQSIS